MSFLYLALWTRHLAHHQATKKLPCSVDIYLFRSSYIFECKKFTLNLDDATTLNRNYFSDEFFRNNASKLYNLKYSNLYAEDGTVIQSDVVREITGLNLTEVQLFRLRGICITARTRLKKRRNRTTKNCGH
jgi:hypothetical protein